MKHIKRYKTFVKESLVNKHSLDQFKAIRKLSKGIDIGDKVTKMKGANLAGESNFIDDNPETIEDYYKSNRSFKTNQNTRDFKAIRESLLLNEGLDDKTLRELLKAFTICFLTSYLSHVLLSNVKEVSNIVSKKIDSHQVSMKFEDTKFVIYCSDNKCVSIQHAQMVELVDKPSQFPVKWGRMDPDKTEHYTYFREFILDTCVDVIEQLSTDKMYVSESINRVAKHKIFEDVSINDITQYRFFKMLLYNIFSKSFLSQYNDQINIIIERQMELHDIGFKYPMDRNKAEVITCSDEEALVFDLENKLNILDLNEYRDEFDNYDDMYGYWSQNKNVIIKDKFHYFKEFMSDIIVDISTNIANKLEI